MPIPLPNLDNRRFTDLVEEGKRLIPGAAPSWTDHNPSDPGITFIELFAFIAEMLLYRADRVTEANKRAFIKLLRGPTYTPSQSIDEDIRLAILELRDEQRAVTSQDFQRLAKDFHNEHSLSITRAHCLPRRNLESGEENAIRNDAPAHVSVLIVPYTSELGRDVKDFLEPRCLLTTRLHIVSPVYLKVTVNVVVNIFVDQNEIVMEKQIKAQLAAYFAPLPEGSSSQGWPFGQAIYVSELYAFLDSIDGVDYVIPSGEDDKPELIAENNPQSPRRILEGQGANKKLIGIHLEPNELVDFDQENSSIVVKRLTTLIPEK